MRLTCQSPTPSAPTRWSVSRFGRTRSARTDQDRREDRQPWPLCRVSDGRSRHSQKSLCRHSADDRGTAAAARCIDSVMRSVSRIPSKTGGKVRLDDGNSANSAFVSTSERPYTLRKRVRGDPGLPITTNRRRVVFNRHLSGECRLEYSSWIFLESSYPLAIRILKARSLCSSASLLQALIMS